MNRRRQSQSAERVVNQQSSIKLQSEQKQTNQLDPMAEMEYIEEILQLMARINRTQYQEASQLKHVLKTQNAAYLNLLQLIMSVIDPYFEIKSFSDEKFQLFLRRLGYPCKNISKTRFMSLGSSHTYLQSLHILAWLCKQAQQILSINERIENGQYQTIEIELESATDKMKKKLAEFLQYGYTNQIDEGQLEKCYKDNKQKLQLDNMNLQKDISRLTCELNIIKTQEPNLQDYEDQYKQLDNELINLTNDVQENQHLLEQTRQEINYSMNKHLELDDEILKLHKLIENKRNQISQQPIKIEKAKEMEQKDHQLTLLSQQQLNDLSKLQQQLDKYRQDKTDILCKLQNFYSFLNQGNIKLEKNFDVFEKNIPISAQLIESKEGLQNSNEENLLDFDLIDLQFEQKLMNFKLDGKRRKSVQAYDFLIKRDSESILQILLPNKNEIIQELQFQSNTLSQKLIEKNNQINEIKGQITKNQKQIEEIECAKNMSLQEITHLTDSTEELKVMKEIFLQHQAKQQLLLKEIDQKKMEIKYLNERKNLDEIEITRMKSQLIQVQETIQNMQQQAEIIEENNAQQQINFKEWVKENLDTFLLFVQENQILI